MRIVVAVASLLVMAHDAVAQSFCADLNRVVPLARSRFWSIRDEANRRELKTRRAPIGARGVSPPPSARMKSRALRAPSANATGYSTRIATTPSTKRSSSSTCPAPSRSTWTEPVKPSRSRSARPSRFLSRIRKRP